MTRSQSLLLIRFLLTLLQFYNNKFCFYRLRWNYKKESWWSWYHRFLNPSIMVLCWEKNSVSSQLKKRKVFVIFFFATRRDKRRQQWHHCHLLCRKKNAKHKKGGGEGNLPSSSHFCHHLEVPLAFTLLLPPCWSSFSWGTLEAPNPWNSCGSRVPEALSYSSSF